MPDAHVETRDRLLYLNPWQVEPATFAREVARHVPEHPVPRAIAPLVRTTRKASLVVGPRQAGKSTWLWQQLADREPRTMLFVDCEEPLLRALCASPVNFARHVEAWLPLVRVIFLEEAQHLTEAGLFIKGLVDLRHDFEVWVTGSSSYELASKTRESLAGRAQRRRILPFSLNEETTRYGHLPPAVREARAEERVAWQWLYGGYPDVATSADPANELRDLLEAFVIRDASDRFRILRPDAFRRLIQLAAGQTGALVNLAEWAALLGISASTVGEYISLLEDGWIIRRVPAFVGGKRSEITSAQRLFFVDPGLRNAALGAFSTDLVRRADRGALAEGWVFAELLKTLPEDWTIHYWRAKGGAEMDFVLCFGERRIAVEVKAGGRPNLTRSARSFCDAYSPEALLMVTGTSVDEERLGPTRVLRPGFARLAATVATLVQETPR